MLYIVHHTKSSVLQSHLFPCYSLLPSLTHLFITILLSASVRVYFCLTPLRFSPSLQPLSPLTALSLSSVSLSLLLFCLLVYFVHSIPYISQIKWCLPYSDWLISLSTIFLRSIHAVAKDNVFFLSFFIAK